MNRSEKNKNIVVLVKDGNYYRASGDDALVMWYLFNYKYKNNTIEFVKDKLLEVLVRLKVRGVPVVCVIENEETYYKVEDNKYEDILNEAEMYYELENNVDVVVEVLKIKLNNLS